MTTERRLERDLSQILGDLAMGPYPDYIDDVLATTAQRRQRPAWTFPERWLPMDIVTTRVPTTAFPWRQLGLLALIALLAAAALAVYVGTQPRLPQPFGLARNGLVAYAAEGDIYTVDPVIGVATAIVAGPDTDIGPRFSLDGTHVVFERKIKGDIGPGQLYVARSDGSDLTLVTPEPVWLTTSLLGELWEQYQFSPDGRSVLIASSDGGYPTISVAQSDGSGVRRLDVGMAAYEPSFRPPDGAEILFVGNGSGSGHDLFAVDPSTGTVRTIIESPIGFDLAGARWSPNGSQIAYWSWGGPGEGLNVRTRVISADGTGDRELPTHPDAVWNAGSEWSNDGTRLFLRRGYTAFFEDVRPVVIPADGSSLGIEFRYPGVMNAACCSAWEWSPDDSAILGTPTDNLGRPMQQVTIDPLTGVVRPTTWSSTSEPTWQRVAH